MKNADVVLLSFLDLQRLTQVLDDPGNRRERIAEFHGFAYACAIVLGVSWDNAHPGVSAFKVFNELRATVQT